MNKIKGYASWLWGQLQGWSTASYLLVGLSAGFNVGVTITAGVYDWVSMSTMVCGFIGVLCVVAISNAKRINGYLGAVNAIMLMFLAYHAGNFYDIILQLCYFFVLDMAVILGHTWGAGFKPKSIIVGKITKSNWNKLASWKAFAKWRVFLMVVAVLVGSFVVFYYFGSYIHHPRVVVDGLATSLGLTGAILCAKGYKTQYFYWAAQGLFSVILWGITYNQGAANPVLLGTYSLYLLNDVLGFFDSEWFGFKAKRIAKKQAKLDAELLDSELAE